MKIEAYWNTRAEAFSVRENAFGRGKIVVGHASKLMLRDVTISGSIIRGQVEGVIWDDSFIFGVNYMDNWLSSDRAYAKVATKRLGVDVKLEPRVRTQAPMAYLRRFDNKPIILAFDPLLMTDAETYKGP
jgi:hypothetical protein